MQKYSQKYMNGYIAKIINKASMPEQSRISEKIQYFALEAYKQDISDWSDARLFAQDPLTPDWTDYIRVCDDVMVDSHMYGIIRAIKKKVKAKGWGIYNEKQEIDEELTKYFDSFWFKKFIDLIIEGDIYPYSVIQLGDWDNGFKELQEIKREYYTPQYYSVKPSLYINISNNNGWNLKDKKYNPYFIVIRSDDFLGLIDHVAPLILGKKHMLIYWWRYGEQYGLPFKIGRTDAADPKRKRALENVFKNMGNSTWMVGDIDDQIELLQPSNAAASTNVFLENLKYANQEISKALAGAVGFFDEKSFVGSAEAGERLFDAIIDSYCRNVEDYANNELLPRIVNSYKDNRFANKRFYFDYSENVTFEQKLKAVEVLSRSYDLDEHELQEVFNFKVEKKQTTQNTLNKLKNHYDGKR